MRSAARLAAELTQARLMAAEAAMAIRSHFVTVEK